MRFQADMVIPLHGMDDLGQEAKATTTFVSYRLCLRLKDEDKHQGGLPLEIVSEQLTHIRASDYKQALGFKVSPEWMDSTITGKRFAANYISTDEEQKAVLIHQDNGPGKSSGGRTRRLSTDRLPRTVLSSANALENPTASLVRQEMRSWKLLQLEPTALRRPDHITAPVIMDARGSHLPATLWNLAHDRGRKDELTEQRVYATAANRLAELLDDVKTLRVDRDDKRDTLTLSVAGRDGTFHPARFLSDGTLRFLALAVLELDPRSQGVICMEEPENGIHPARIPAILSLLRDIAVDTSEAVGPQNPLRQVIINTHSPTVVLKVPEDSLLIAETLSVRGDDGFAFGKVVFSAIAGTWRQKLGGNVLPRGNLLTYLNPLRGEFDDHDGHLNEHRRVLDNPSVQEFLFGDAA